VIRTSPDVVARRLEDEIVLVNLTTNRIFSLNRTGGRYWELLDEGLEQEVIVGRLLDEFDVDRPTLEQEIADITVQLRREGLVSDT
jgi:Coenzyme PQQ synthesis protein D (PqqD)